MLGSGAVTGSNSVKRCLDLTSKLIFSERDYTKFRLGVEAVTAINDGGLGILYNTGTGYTQWQPGGIRPVLSLEARPVIL